MDKKLLQIFALGVGIGSGAFGAAALADAAVGDLIVQVGGGEVALTEAQINAYAQLAVTHGVVPAAAAADVSRVCVERRDAGAGVGFGLGIVAKKPAEVGNTDKAEIIVGKVK